MATLKGSTIASTFDSLVKRADSYSQTGTNIELMDDSHVIKPTGLYLESGATTDHVGIGTASPSYPLEITTADENIARFISSDNQAQIIIQDDGEQCFVGVSDDNDICYVGPGSGASALNINITSAGNVGIGNYPPIVGFMLQRL